MRKARRTQLIIIFVIIDLITLVGFATWYFLDKEVATDDPQPQAAAFPILEGQDLTDTQITIPHDLRGEQKLLVVAYDSDQQSVVDAWLDPLEALNDEFPNLRGYYVPLLPKEAADRAGVIIGFMSLAAGSQQNRERTIIVFTDVGEFNRLMDVVNTSEIQLFLLDKDNGIVWRSQGEYTAEKLNDLQRNLAQSVK